MKYIFTPEIKQTLDTLVKHYPKEFTLFGKTRIEGEKIHLIDLRVPEQTSSTGDTELSEDELEKFLLGLLDDGENPKDWNMWIHSHHSLGAFWSQTDRDQMNSFNTGGPAHFFHLVLSTTGFQGAYSLYKPFSLFLDDIKQEVEGDEVKSPALLGLEEERDKLAEEVSEIEDKILTIMDEDNPRTETLKKELDVKNKIYVHPSSDRGGYQGLYAQEFRDVPGFVASVTSRMAEINRMNTASKCGKKDWCFCIKCGDQKALETLHTELLEYKEFSMRDLKKWWKNGHICSCVCEECLVVDDVKTYLRFTT